MTPNAHDDYDRQLDRLCNWNRERLQKRRSDEEARRQAYEEYMDSPQWAKLRDLVLKRASYVCECCLVNPAVQAHHLTYEHFMCERAWELRAVCLQCHERIHTT